MAAGEPWRRRAVFEAVIQAVATGVVAALLVTTLGPWAAAKFAQFVRTPNCGDTSGLRRLTPSGATATSSLASERSSDARGTITYGPQMLYDGDTGTSWVEGVRGFGAGQSATLKFDGKVKIVLLCVVDGYTFTWDLYQRNARVRGLDLIADDGSTSESVTLQDAGTPERPAVFQDVLVDLPATESLTLKITSVYTSLGKGRYLDTCLSEVEIWSKQ